MLATMTQKTNESISQKLERLWSQIYRSSELPASLLLESINGVRIYATVSKQKLYSITFRSTNLSMSTNIKLRSIELLIQSTDSSSDEYLTISLLDESLKSYFNLLCTDLIGLPIIHKRDQFAEALVTRIQKWKRLFDSLPNPLLSNNDIRGLVSELYVLRELATVYSYPKVDTIGFWKGPLGSPKDFELPNGFIEVKSRSVNSKSIRISSVEQLELEPEKYLVLAVVDLKQSSVRDSNNNSVSELVNKIRTEFCLSEDSLNSFNLLLTLYGFSDNEAYNSIYFCPVSVTYYEVSELFPRVISGMMPEAIVDVRYSLLLSSIDSFKIPEPMEKISYAI
jgi:Putative  PD-(D/E)XK family member, (DUF4420)